MANILMWKRGDERCVLVLSEREPRLRLVDGTTLVREEIVTCDSAVLLADLWRSEAAAAAVASFDALMLVRA